jgi:protease-4
VAYPLTLTGSIGIYGGKFSLEGLSELVGIRVETLQRGRNAGVFSTASTRTSEERERFRTYLQQRYIEFVANVAQGREMTMMTADEIAQGRVWSGAQAAELGLVDALGGLDTAIAMMKERLEIPEEEDISLIPYPRPGSPLEILRQRFGGFVNSGSLVSLRDLMASGVPEEIRTLNQQLETLIRLQDEQAFAWWPARIRMK